MGVALPHLVHLGDQIHHRFGIRFPQSTICQPRTNGGEDEIPGHDETLSRHGTSRAGVPGGQNRALTESATGVGVKR